MLLSISVKTSARARAAAQSYLGISLFVHSWLKPRVSPRLLRHSRNKTTAIQQITDRYKHTLSLSAATCEIEDLPRRQSGVVTLHGYLGSQRVLSQKRLCFAPLYSKDLKHNLQIVSNLASASHGNQSAHETLMSLTARSPIAVTGLLKERAAQSKSQGNNGSYDLSNMELELHSIQPLNSFPKDVVLAENTKVPPEKRYLQLRHHSEIRDALRQRAHVAASARSLLNEEAFTEIETPLLFKSTPEGAREFIVPTRQKGLAYALPQSPQQFKQILMAGCIPKYYQIARCFRDEDLRADRQPEFTQIDLEMAFATGEDVMALIERLMTRLWEAQLPGTAFPKRFPRMTYAEAMGRYGSDKPDTRLAAEIRRLDHLLPVDLVAKISDLALPAVEGFHLPLGSQGSTPAETLQFVRSFLDSHDGEIFNTNPHGGPGVFVFDSSKPLLGLQAFGFEAAEALEDMFDLEPGDLIILQARTNAPFSGGSTMIGNLRLALFHEAVRQKLLPAPTGFSPLWIIDFPLFSTTSTDEPGQSGSAGLSATHHPFTSPKTPEDVELLFTEPEKAVGDHYDLVINGAELGGGSRRIQDADMQKLVMEHVLCMPEERIAEFDHLLEALRAGCPPHAGIALGFDRLIAIMLGRDSVRDVMAFPKWGEGNDPFVKSPSAVSEETLRTYHLRLQ